MSKKLVSAPPQQAPASAAAMPVVAFKPSLPHEARERSPFDNRAPWASAPTSGFGGQAQLRPFANLGAAWHREWPGMADTSSTNKPKVAHRFADVRVAQSRAPSVPAMMIQRRVETASQAEFRDSARVQSASAQEQKSDCVPDKGTTDCEAYKKNDWWLPSAYVHNATCACQETPNEPKANCIRLFLQKRMSATPEELKKKAARMKKFENVPRSRDPLLVNYFAYQAFVQKELTPQIHQDHVDAYSSCCCPSGPAPYPAWVGVTSVPLSCDMVRESIMQVGSCNGTRGKW